MQSKSTIRRVVRRGMTLMELMVSVTILAIMILGFNSVLSSSQRVVTESQRTMKANAAIAATSQTLRSDFRSISKAGILHLYDKAALFTTFYPTSSMSFAGRAGGTLVAYRLGDNKYEVDKEGGSQAVRPRSQILCRQSFLLAEPPPGGGLDYSTPPTDVYYLEKDGNTAGCTSDGELVSPAMFLSHNSTTLDAVGQWILDRAPEVSVPVQNAAHWRNMWQVFMPGVLCDGTTTPVPRFSIYYWTTDASGNVGPRSLAGGSGVKFSRMNQNNWPDFVLIFIELSDRAVEYDAYQSKIAGVGRAFEIICPIAR